MLEKAHGYCAKGFQSYLGAAKKRVAKRAPRADGRRLTAVGGALAAARRKVDEAAARIAYSGTISKRNDADQQERKRTMKSTAKALIFGVAMAAAGLGVIAAVTPASPVVKLDPVVITAKRLPAEEVVKLATVEVTASRAQVLAAQALEAGKQAAAAATPNS
jgi:hypothetical protein